MSFKIVSPPQRLWLLTLFLATHICAGFYSYNLPRFHVKTKFSQFVINENLIEDDVYVSPPFIPDEQDKLPTVTNRRLVMSTLLMSIGMAVGADFSSADVRTPETSLKWEASPINKRSGVTVFQAEKNGYNVRFVTYLSRFLLSFDPECQRWWYTRAGMFHVPKESYIYWVIFHSLNCVIILKEIFHEYPLLNR
jgi:hypothetical protein